MLMQIADAKTNQIRFSLKYPYKHPDASVLLIGARLRFQPTGDPGRQ